MPTITLQVGQAGNQLGQALWERLVAQSGADRAADTELFRVGLDGKRRARCLLIDTEPKVVNGVLSADREALFSRQQCYVGQSGRGNNWAFGYNQLRNADPSAAGAVPYGRPAAAGGGTTALGPAWVSSTATEDPSQAEFRILEHVYDGIRREAEEADGCPTFFMVHSLAGGSGSGMGSRVLEHLRSAYPLAHIATASVAPRPAGDTPMQSLNATMSLSFLQAYADAVLLLSNQDLMDACQRPSVAALLPGGGGAGGGGGGGGMDAINRLAAHNLAGLLWPLDGADALGGVGRIRDTVCTVAADPCTKMLETWTVHANPATAVTGLWSESVRSLNSLMPRADALRANAPISTAGAMLIARGYPEQVVPSGNSATTASARTALLSSYHKALGPQGAAPTLEPDATLVMRRGQAALSKDVRKLATGPIKPPPGGAAPSLTAVSNRSGVVGLLEGTVRRALALCDAGAYLHWYARHGCSEDAVRDAAHNVLDVAACYRQLHRLPHDDAD
ncbi:hypothetical protein HYH03_008277 [Edaphochlamys debaryana]|uniref:Tubulin/FtsZ GTPase domain-containing protein n=1 Tax=Edaphochlamys debaryana TaxID=47281 RepID=A0A835Y6Q1_9CHLO|nr:hypothetical protein HYH03_008277 [Edaphochlamys debaryana]|eukprot:KAG2493460.1 hypothetical protein HYH03_008277 [Edaphochlamys debaryana]